MKVSITEASKLASVSRTTIYSDMKEGKLTFETDPKGKKVIDISELERVYGRLNSVESVKTSSENKPEQTLTGDVQVGVQVELAVLKEKLKTLETEREREREQLSSEIETLRKNLDKAQDQQSKLGLLLTDQSKDKDERAGDQEKKFDELVKANELLRKQNRRVLYELKAQKEMSLFERLFGKKEKRDMNRRVGE